MTTTSAAMVGSHFDAGRTRTGPHVVEPRSLIVEEVGHGNGVRARGARRDQMLDGAHAAARDQRDANRGAHGANELHVEAFARALVVDRSHEDLARAELFAFASPLDHVLAGALAAVVG